MARRALLEGLALVLDALIAALIGAAGGGSGGGIVPSLGAVSVASTDGGACDIGFGGAHDASIRTSWSVTNPDDVNYVAKLYENGSLVATLASSVTHRDKTITGAVEDGVAGSGGHSTQWTSNWTYRVDLVRISDSTVLQSVTSSPWVQNYNVCTV